MSISGAIKSVVMLMILQLRTSFVAGRVVMRIIIEIGIIVVLCSCCS